MQKLKRFAVLSCIVLVGFSTTQCFPEDEMIPICYFGVTQVVSQKIAKRYIKIGATLGACGQEPQIPLPQ